MGVVEPSVAMSMALDILPEVLLAQSAHKYP